MSSYLKTSFFKYIAQTSKIPPAINIISADGIYLFDNNGKKFFDLISGIAVSSYGHNNKIINNAIQTQLNKYLHVMAYGEMVLAPQVLLAENLASVLPSDLNCSYFVNSGSEAVEGAIKLAKKYTQKTQIISFKNAYHGSTHGALSLMGNEYFKNPFRPLLPDILQLEFNNIEQLKQIGDNTACVVIEPIQGEAGVRIPSLNYMKDLRKICNDKNALLIFDESQTAMGRTGKLFAFQHFNIIPDIIILAKSFGAGMPLGAFISSKKIMDTLSCNPSLGHITTFGGHPLSCAAAIAGLKILNEDFVESVTPKANFFKKLIKANNKIKEFRNFGLLMAIEFESEAINKKIIKQCLKNGILTDWFLFAPNCLRIAPPLTITFDEIEQVCEILNEIIDKS